MASVSVVIPCFNDGLHLLEAVTSVRAQTFKDIEILVIDDGSTDSATKVALDQLSKERDVVVLTTVNQGPSKARNLGISKTAGRYIICVDADDRLHEDYLQRAFEFLESHSDFGVCYCKARRFGAINDSWGLPDFEEMSFAFDNCVFVTALVRREAWQAVGGFCEKMIHGMEDYDFWVKVVSRGYKIHRLDDELFFYRIKKNSRTTRLGKGPNELEMFDQIVVNNIDYYCRPEFVRRAHQRMRLAERYIYELHQSRKWKVFLLVRHPKQFIRLVYRKLKNMIRDRIKGPAMELE